MVLPAAASSPRQLLVWSVPTVAFVLSILWYRRRHRGSKRQTDPGGTTDSNPESTELSHSQTAVCCSEEEEVKCQIKSVCSAANEVAPTDNIKVISYQKAVELSSCEKEILLQENEICQEKEVVLLSVASDQLVSEVTAQVEKITGGASTKLEVSEELVLENTSAAEVSEGKVVASDCTEVAGSEDFMVESSSSQLEVVERACASVSEAAAGLTMTEEASVVGASSEDPAAPVMTKISVDVSAKESTVVAVKSTPVSSHQPRDSANHSPAEAMLASPSISNDSDTHSVGSNDSGKGGSDVTTPVLEDGNASKQGARAGSSRRTSTSSSASAEVAPPSSSNVDLKPVPVKQPCCVYEFVISQQLVGRLIGKHGCFVQQIKSETNSSIFVKRHPESPKYKVCAIEGTQTDIEGALKLIRKKFPVKKYPSVTLERVSFLPPCGNYPLIPESLQMYLVEGVNNDVILSSLVTAGHMFLQQPTHPTFPVLARLIVSMSQCYLENESPQLPLPAPGIVCAAPSADSWYRAEVIDVRTEELEEEGEESEDKVAEERTVCDIKFVDYGGFMTLPSSELRQIRTDFMMLPFQATECYLADVTWLEGEECWSEAATLCIEELTKGQVLQAQVVGYAENGTPFVRLFTSVLGHMAMMVNEILVHRGLAKYWDPVVVA